MSNFDKVFRVIPPQEDPEVKDLMQKIGVKQVGICKTVRAIGAEIKGGLISCVRNVGGMCTDFWETEQQECPNKAMLADTAEIDTKKSEPLQELLQRLDVELVGS